MKVKVWNDNKYAHAEVFQGEKISIPPKTFVWMEEDQAVMFRGQYTPIMVDYDHQPMEQSYKMIRIEKPGEGSKEAATELKGPEHFSCMRCGLTAPSRKELEAHIDEKHLEDLSELEPELAEKRRRGRPKKSEEIAA